MVTELRGIDGEIEDIYGTYMSPDGEVKALYRDIDGINFEKTGEWTSPTTSGTYPSGWVLDIKSLDMNLTLDPVADDQEVTAGLPGVSSYWEGKVRVSGNPADQSKVMVTLSSQGLPILIQSDGLANKYSSW